MPQSCYGGFEDEGDMRVVAHITREPEVVIVGEPPTITTMMKYVPYYPSFFDVEQTVQQQIESQNQRVAWLVPFKRAMREWVTENREIILLDRPEVHVYGFYRYYIAFLWKPEGWIPPQNESRIEETSNTDFPALDG